MQASVSISVVGEPQGELSRLEIRADNRRFHSQTISRPRRARDGKKTTLGGSLEKECLDKS